MDLNVGSTVKYRAASTLFCAKFGPYCNETSLADQTQNLMKIVEIDKQIPYLRTSISSIANVTAVLHTSAVQIDHFMDVPQGSDEWLKELRRLHGGSYNHRFGCSYFDLVVACTLAHKPCLNGIRREVIISISKYTIILK